MKVEKGGIMSEIIIKCPKCTGKLRAETEWNGKQLECPRCHELFVASVAVPNPVVPGGPLQMNPVQVNPMNPVQVNPMNPGQIRPLPGVSAPSFPPPRSVNQGSSAVSGDEEKSSRDYGAIIGLCLKIVIALIVIGAGIFGYLWITKVTPESMKGNQMYAMTNKRVNNSGAIGMAEIARNDFFPRAWEKSDFLYKKSNFTGISLKEIGPDEYEGEIEFDRNQKKMVRPVYIDRRGSFTNYHFPFKYADHPEYLQEDGDLIFDLAAENIDKKLQGWSYVSGTADGNILTCTIKKDDKEKTLKLKAEQVTGKDNIARVWVEILSD